MRTINLLDLPLEDDEDNDNIPILFDLSKHLEEDSTIFRLTLNALRKCEYLTDVYVLAKNQVFLAHKLMLHLASDHFHHFQRSADEFDVITLKDLDSKSVNIMLDFIYTGQISLKSISIANIKELLYADEQLQLHCFRMVLLSSIVSHLSIANFERFWDMAEETKFPQLIDAVIRFLQRQFDYLGTSSQFLSLPLKRVRELHNGSLSHPRLHFALKPYLHHHRLHYSDLLDDFERLKTPLPSRSKADKPTRQELPNFDKYKVLKKYRGKSTSNRDLHSNRDQFVDHPSADPTTTTFISFPTNEANQSFVTSRFSQRKPWTSTRPPWAQRSTENSGQPKTTSATQTILPKQIPTVLTGQLLLVVAGGPRHNNIHLMYSPLNQITWMGPEELNLPVQKSSSFVHGNRCLYMIGGDSYERNKSSCYCWDMTLRQRTQLFHLIVRRSNPQLAVIGSIIYVVGGSGWFSSRLSQTEYLVRTEGVWHLASATKQPRDETASMVASSAKGKLYIVGGGTSKCEEFCIKQKLWSELPSLPEDLTLFQSKVMLGLAYDTLIAFYDYRPTKVFLLVPHRDIQWQKFYTKEPLPDLVQCCTSWNNKVLVLCKKGAIYNYNLPKNVWCFVKQVPKPWTEMFYVGVINLDR